MALDVICIGAVNYDYMFHCTQEDLKMRDDAEGSENLSNANDDVENDVLELVGKGRDYTTQVGGSAFITLKVIKHIFQQFKVAYVGVCGTLNSFDMKYGKSNDIEMETAHLDNKDWFFRTDKIYDDPLRKAIAKSIVRLYNHSRNCIKIAPNANNTLLERIIDKENSTGENFEEYLASAKWIHLSSLSDFDQFEAIMQRVINAKKLNPNLLVSMDPGFEYTSLRKDRLQPLLAYVDYVFLNKSEKKNLGGNVPRARELYKNLREYFDAINPMPTRTLIVKYDDRHELLNFVDGKVVIRTVRHKKLYQYQLNNDTGAGDSFAGGVISGLLSVKLNHDIEKAIQLGVLAAKGRMISFDYQNPYMNIQRITRPFVRNNIGEK